MAYRREKRRKLDDKKEEKLGPQRSAFRGEKYYII